MFLVTLLIGLLMLVGGAELVVRGGGQVALAMRIPALIVGLTIVAFGTSAPELGVSLAAAMGPGTEMALANVIGSNIANIVLVLGLSALVRPLLLDERVARREIPVCVLLQIMVPLFALNGVIGRAEGLALFAVGVGYNVWLIREARIRRARVLDDEEEIVASDGSTAYHLLQLFAGIALIGVGSYLFVGGAEVIALKLGLSPRYVGLTVVALGTSAPELATSIMSSYRGESDLAVGNVLGSNILNITLVLALTTLIQPIQLPNGDANVDLGVAFVATLLMLPLVLRDRPLGRLEGGVLAGGYLAYVLLTPM